MANRKLYIHEFVDILGQNRARYMHHATANWSPQAREERGQLCFGVFGTVGTTGRWPEVVNMWEEDGFEGMASSFERELSSPKLQDPSLEVWWAEAAKYRRGGLDRLLVPAPWTRTIEELTADGVRGEVYAHELVQVKPGRSPEFLEHVRDTAIAAHAPHGMQLVGAFETAMRNDSECLVIWAIESWSAWAAYERAQRSDEGLLTWRNAIRDVAIDWQRTLLVEAEFSPMRIGRQPEIGDRRKLEDV